MNKMESNKRHIGEKYNLKWNSYRNSLVSYLVDHLSKEELVDVTLTCDGKYIRAHKLILSACSAYFKELFQIHKAENPIIILNNVKFEQLKHVVDFIYNGEIKVIDSDLEGVLSLGSNLKIKGLSNIKEKSSNKKMETFNEESAKQTKNAKGDGKARESTKPGTKNMNKPSEGDEKSELSRKEKQKTKTSTGSHESQQTLVTESVQKVTEKNEVHIKTNLNSIQSDNEQIESLHKSKRRKTNSINMAESEKVFEDIINQSASNMTEEPHHHISQGGNVQNYFQPKKDIGQKKSDNFIPTTTDIIIPTSSLMNITTEMDDSSQNLLQQNQKTTCESSETENPVKIEEVDHDYKGFLEKKNSDSSSETNTLKPVSAFMIFAKEWRKRLAVEHPKETNKQISIRLSNMWKNLSEETRDTFYEVASRAYEKQKKNVSKN